LRSNAKMNRLEKHTIKAMIPTNKPGSDILFTHS
jgi:hypothetical protein